MTQYTITKYDKKDYEDFKNNLTDMYAIELLGQISRKWLPDYYFTGEEHDFEAYCMNHALYRAMDALEKQIPMKVTDIHVDEYYCPTCGAENNCDQGIVGDKFCPVCGQAILQERIEI